MGEGVAVGVNSDKGVADGCSVFVAVWVALGVAECVADGVGESVAVWLGDGVGEGDGVCVTVPGWVAVGDGASSAIITALGCRLSAKVCPA